MLISASGPFAAGDGRLGWQVLWEPDDKVAIDATGAKVWALCVPDTIPAG